MSSVNRFKLNTLISRPIVIQLMAALLAALAILACLPPALHAEDSSSVIAARISDAQDELNRMSDELDEIQRRLDLRDNKLDENRQLLADMNARLRIAEAAYNESLSIYENRIRALYKQGDNYMMRFVVDSDGFNDMMTRITYVDRISDNDIKLLRRVKHEAEQVRYLRLQVDELKQVSAEDVSTLLARRDELKQAGDKLQKKLDADMVELLKVRAIEQEAAAERLAAEAAWAGFIGPYGGVTVGGGQPEGLEASGIVMSGIASWYGPGFHGNTTANGERYDMYGFTAAHKTLPFNTWLKVSYNGRSVFVRINDRGPYVGERYLDLSKSAAQALGFSGVAYVTAEIYR